MKNAVKRAVSLIVFLALLFSMIPTNFVGVFASFASGNGWEQVNSNTFIVYNNKITGSGLIEIFNYFTTNEFDSYRFAYMHPDYAGEVWSNHGIEIVADVEYSIEFSKYGYADIYFCPKPYWNSTETYGIRINYHVAPETEPADPRKPAQVDELINKDLGKFDTESQFESALKSSVSASWSTADGSGKVDQANIIISLAFKGETKNSTGETVRTYSASVSITEGENWLATEQEVVIDGIFWTVNQYVITFDTVGGTQILPIKQDYGTAVALPSNPTKEGYNFIGWDKDIPSTMPAENITVTAMWEEETKTVGFDPNGGKWSDGSGETKIVSFKVGDKTDDFQAPTREGYDFGGWQKSEVPAPGADESYIAIWNVGKTVTFKDGDTVYEKSYTAGEFIALPQVGEKVGYTFVGWDKLDANGVGDGLTDSVISVMGNESVTYVAVWKAKRFTVKFFGESGDLIEAKEYDYGSILIVPENTVKTGHTFAGWDLAKGGEYDGIADVISSTVFEDLDYRELFIINRYTITFDTAGGTAIDPITQDYGTKITPPERPTKIGCEFDGWDINIPQTMPAKDITITARWRSISYTITFDTDGGSEIAPITLAYGSAVALTSKPTKTGHTFAGWDGDIPSTMPAENITLKAKWTVNQYTITFDTDGGTAIESITQDYGTSVSVPADPEKAYHTFAGWDRDIPATMPAENLIVKAKWNVNLYTLTFDTAGGSEIAPITQGYGTEISRPADPVRDGYKFIGWDKDIPSTMPPENITITAKWELATKTVSYDPNGGFWSDGTDESKTATLNQSDNAEKYQAPSRSGYDFSGWKKNETSPDGVNESYTAVWTLGKTVVFKDGDKVYEKNYAVGETVNAPQLGEILGYTFIGWDLIGANGVGDGFKDAVIPIMGNESVSYVSIWEANKYTVIFYNENDEIIEAITEKYGSPFGISITPVKTGYTFAGWDLKKDGKYDGIADPVSSVMGAENLEYRELFAIGLYTITFDSAGGSAVAPITQAYGTEVVPPEHPTKEGYVFEGWDRGVPTTMPAQNITLTARWKKATYTINWDINADGVINDYDIVTTVEHGEIPSLPPFHVPTKDSTAEYSYTFTNSWLPALKPADGDATYTAQYDAVRRKYTVKFLNYDGTELQVSEVEYGSLPIYNGKTPVKIDDKQYDYTFVGWLPQIEKVTGNATYIANFSESIKKFTVVWLNWDGSVLETDIGVEHGDMPRYDGKTPTKPSTDNKTYIFAGWDPQLSGVSSDVTYTATFAEKTKSYSITWKNDDGSIIDVTVVEHGKMPSYAAPTKPSTAEYSYEFAGWTPAVVPAVADATYTASYTATKIKYTVVWNVGGVKTSESYEYGAIPEFKGSTDKLAEGCTAFEFNGWDKKLSAVVGNVEYTAIYKQVTKHISCEFTYTNNGGGNHTKKNKCCSAVIETERCSDVPGDSDHKCDLCGADSIGLHSGGKSTCKTLAKCAECGASYGAYDKNNHESAQIAYADVTKTTHDELYACCGAMKSDNAKHIFGEQICPCGTMRSVTVKFMNGEILLKAFVADFGTMLSVEEVSAPAPTKGYVFAGWYTASGTRVEKEIMLTGDLVLYAKYIPGDVDGNGRIESLDADVLNKYIVGESVFVVDDKNALDVNRDGRITVADSVAILFHISGKQPISD